MHQLHMPADAVVMTHPACRQHASRNRVRQRMHHRREDASGPWAELAWSPNRAGGGRMRKFPRMCGGGLGFGCAYPYRVAATAPSSASVLATIPRDYVIAGTRPPRFLTMGPPSALAGGRFSRYFLRCVTYLLFGKVGDVSAGRLCHRSDGRQPWIVNPFDVVAESLLANA